MAETEMHNITITMADIDKIINRVVEDKIEAEITITPEMTEILFRPYVPYRSHPYISEPVE